MANFLLVHGACFGAWAWAPVLPALAALGHHGTAIDLQGTTLSQNAAAIADLARSETILVGHSAAGFAITAAAELAPAGIGGLIYLCAYVPQVGQSLAQMRRAAPSQPLAPAIRKAGHGQYGFDMALAEALFFHDCPSPATWAAKLRLDPIAPMETPLPVIRHNLPRAAIICARDRAILPDYQRHMARDIPLLRHLPCGHAPFLAAPSELAAVLDDLAQAFQSGRG